MKKLLFKGCGTAIATPFTKDKINFNELAKFLDFQINNNVDAIIVCGTTGEAATMTEKEKKDTIKFVIDKVNKKVPIIAGTGSNCTSSAIELTKYAESVGADGVLTVTPYYNKTTQNGLIEHYSAIANSTQLPIILYNVPSRTGVNILPETCFKLSKIKNIVAIKEASGDISQIAKISSLCGNNLNIYSGNDDQIIPILSLGGLGVISVLSNIEPNYVHELTKFYFNGNYKKALSMQLNALNLISSLFCEVNPIPIKKALNIYNFNFGEPRLPLIKISEKNQKILQNSIDTFNKL